MRKVFVGYVLNHFILRIVKWRITKGLALFFLSIAFASCNPFLDQPSSRRISESSHSTAINAGSQVVKSVPDISNGPEGQSSYFCTQSIGDTFQSSSSTAEDENLTKSGYLVFSSVTTSPN